MQQARSTVVAREADIGLIQHRLTEEFTSVTEKIVQDEASTLISPVRGVVQSIQTSVASDVTPGQPVATVVDLSGVWIVADLRPDEVSRLVPGGVVTVRPSGNARAEPFRAKITTIDGGRSGDGAGAGGVSWTGRWRSCGRGSCWMRRLKPARPWTA